MKDNVHFLPAHPNMTVDQALGVAMRDDLQDVIILGYDQGGDLIIRSSHIKRADALFLIEKAKLHTMGVV